MGDEVRNDNSGTVGGALVQAGTIEALHVHQQSGAPRRTEPTEPAALTVLAGLVEAQWTAEARLRGLEDGADISVEWEAGWDPGESGNAVRVYSPALVEELRGALAYRLVIAGPSGAGKSSLAVRVLQGLLKARKAGQPVPVLFLLSEWNPSTHFEKWLAQRIFEDYGDADPSLDARTVAVLVRDRLVVPVLDGLDELKPSTRRAALAGLQDARGDGPLVLTSRSREYEKESGRLRFLHAMPVLRARPVSAEAAEVYLTEACHPNRRPAWQPVLDELRRNPGGPVATVLSSPLMLWLARVVYEQQDVQPGELTGPGLRTGREVAGHLLDGFIRVKFSSGPPSPYLPRSVARWDPDRAVDHLRFLAGRLNRERTQNLAWWRLRSRLTAPLVWGALVMVVTAVLGTAAGQGLALAFRVLGWSDGTYAAEAMSTIGQVATITAMGGGFVAAYLFGFDGRPRRPAGRRSRVLLAVLAAAAVGLAAWGGQNLAAALTMLLPVLAGAILATPVESGAMGTVTSLPVGERRMALVKALVVAPAIAGVLVLHPGSGGAGAAVSVGAFLDGWLCAALMLTGLSWWGRWTATRAVFAVRGKLPWRILEFLEDAHRLGILRKVGGIHQFRHAGLQQRLDHSWSGERSPSSAGRSELRLWSSRESLRALVDYAFTPGVLVIAFTVLVWPLTTGDGYGLNWRVASEAGGPSCCRWPPRSC
ncbi:NACHT domain-containing protein [Kitasatospora sp. NPDC048545]|uniref:NACHT domain-containing protein n=1 Tax=Kitasatospora sp. NPDC048545 TaxID=3157208 RepID=UPI0033EA0CA9